MTGALRWLATDRPCYMPRLFWIVLWPSVAFNWFHALAVLLR